MIEDEARAALSGFDGVGGVENWIAEQDWQTAPDGWIVTRDLGGWRFQVRHVPGGLQVSATPPGGRKPAVWIVSSPEAWKGTGANDDE